LLQVLDAEVTNSILGDGCVVRAGTTIKHSVIGLRSLIGENCHIEDALIMGCEPFHVAGSSLVDSKCRR
jgi:glucose-1-phosphate adenylyltransferase